MALVHCRECGEKISEQASSCPKCGAPQHQQNKKGGNKGLFVFLIIILFGILGIGGYIYYNSINQEAQNTPENRIERLDVADRLLSKDCAVLTNMSTEYIKNDFAAAVISALGNAKCDCIKETLREKLADKYTLSQLQAFDKMPLHELLEIKQLIEENNAELKGCFPIVNQVKDAVTKH